MENPLFAKHLRPGNRRGPARATWAAAALLSLSGVACAGANSPDEACPPQGEKWFRRAQQDYQTADVDEARDSIGKALAVCGADERLKVLAARIALARLDYGEVLRQLKNIQDPKLQSEVAGLRGRALWYKCDLDAAADQLDAMLNDPEIKDGWAKEIAKLARRGQGRKCFSISGGLLAAVDMPHVSPVAPFFVVPLEIDGESGLALVSTGNAEVVLDSATRKEASWVSLRLGERLEVHDVPAITQDLSGVSKEMGAPIKALIGVNLLRHLNATLDYTGRQFVARSFTPPAPPAATRVDLFYIRGGGMVVKSAFSDKAGRASLLIDTTMNFPIALDKVGWQKAGLDANTFKVIPQVPGLREGEVPMLRLGAYDVPKVPGVYGTPIDQLEGMLGQDIDGVIGNGLLAHFRITFGDSGRLMWIEDNSAVMRMLQESEVVPPPPPPPAAGGAPLGAGSAPTNVAEPAPKTDTLKPGGKTAPPSKPPAAPKAPEKKKPPAGDTNSKSGKP